MHFVRPVIRGAPLLHLAILIPCLDVRNILSFSLLWFTRFLLLVALIILSILRGVDRLCHRNRRDLNRDVVSRIHFDSDRDREIL